MKTAIIDTNILVALYYKNDSTHNQVIKLLSQHKLKSTVLHFNNLILSETITVILGRSKNLQLARQAYNNLALTTSNNFKLTRFNPKLEKTTYQIFFNQPKYHLSIADCSLIAQAKLLNTKYILTLDKKLNQHLTHYHLKSV